MSLNSILKDIKISKYIKKYGKCEEPLEVSHMYRILKEVSSSYNFRGKREC
jgi:hypothetical protein